MSNDHAAEPTNPYLSMISQLTDAIGIVSTPGEQLLINGPAAELLTGQRTTHPTHICFDDLVCFTESDRARIARLAAYCAVPASEATVMELGPLSVRITAALPTGPTPVWVTATLLPPAAEEHTPAGVLLLFREEADPQKGRKSDDTRSTPNSTRQSEQQRNSYYRDGADEQHQSGDVTTRGSTNLTEREAAVLAQTLAGKRVQTIAATLFLSEHTVRNTLKRIYRKLGVHSTAELRESLGSQPLMRPFGSVELVPGARRSRQRQAFDTPA
jgi:DNA-binding CsgD family transcriptional regulator